MNSVRTVVCFAVATIGLLSAHHGRCEAAADSAPRLKARVDSLRIECQFSKALASAKELLELRRGDESSKPYQVADAERLVSTLEFILSLPTEDQKELARAYTLFTESRELFNNSQYDEAKSSADEQIEIYTRLLGPDHPEVATSLQVLGTLYRTLGQYAEAEAPFKRSLAIREKALGPDHPDVAKSLNNLAALYYTQGQYAEAEPFYERSLAIRERVLGPDHPEVAWSLNNLAELYRAQGRYAEAEPFYQRSLAILEKVFGPDHPEVGLSLNNLAGLYETQGRYAEAGSLFKRSLAILEKTLGPEHPDVAMGLNNLALFYRTQGQYAQAEPLHKRALAISEKVLGPEHPDVAWSLNSTAALYVIQGQYAQAKPLYQRALAIWEKALGPDHRLVAQSLHNLAEVYYYEGQYAQAEPLYKRSLAIWEKTLGPEHTDVAKNLHNLAVLYYSQGQYAQAETLYTRALAICEKALGPDHALVATSLNGLAALYDRQGQYARAETLYTRALAIRETTLGPEHPEVLTSLDDLGNLMYRKGDYASAERYLARAAKVYDASRLRAGGGLERATFQESPYPSLALARLASGKTRDAWPAAERSLGRTLADLLFAAKSRPLTSAEIATEDSLLGALTNLESSIEALGQARAKDPSPEAKAEYEEARSRLIAMEAAWSAFQAGLREKYPISEGQPYPFKKIQAALDRKTAIVGWLDADENQGSSTSWAYVIRNKGAVFWARLPSPGEDSDATPFEHSMWLREQLALPGWSAGSLERTARAGREEWRKRVAPLSQALNGVTDLVIIPSGAMLGVPVEALVDETGMYVGDRYSVSYTPSATIYTWLKEREEKRKGAQGKESLLVGDPPFQPEQLADMEKEGGAQTTCLAPRGPRGDRSKLRYVLAGDDDAQSSLNRLPCTRLEVEAITPLVPQPTLFVGPKASEQELVQLAGEGRFKDFQTIHLATHVLVDHERPERSALVLSLVNLPDPLEAVMKGERIYDGLVTAKEVLREWKLDADLVTLSACETALGKEVGGEGYVGLAHSFLQAGARSLIVSLWPVQDQATSFLMKRFYENWTGGYSDVRGGRTGRAMSKADALQEAKRYLRTYTDKNGEKPFEHPFFWSAFILIGDRE